MDTIKFLEQVLSEFSLCEEQSLICLQYLYTKKVMSIAEVLDLESIIKKAFEGYNL